MRAAADGTRIAPKRAVVSVLPITPAAHLCTITLECGHEIEDVPAEAPRRTAYRCIECARLPDLPKHTPAEKKMRKALWISEWEQFAIAEFAHGRVPVSGSGSMHVALTIVRLQKLGYLAHDEALSTERLYESPYVPTALGYAAAVTPNWNESPELWAAVADRLAKR